MLLLDTNVLSELRRPERANPNVRAWSQGVAAIHLFISAITVLEIELGILLMARKDERQGTALRAWFERQVLAPFEERILPVDTAVARRCASLHVPNPCAERDALIAATALVHGLTVVTRNAADFASTGVPMLNPWTKESGR